MVDISLLSPGMKVKIVDNWVKGCHQNIDGRMDHHLGTIVTVKEVVQDDEYYGHYFLIYEDYDEYEEQGGHWHWFGNSVDYIVDELELPDFEVSADDELSSFLFNLV